MHVPLVCRRPVVTSCHGSGPFSRRHCTDRVRMAAVPALSFKRRSRSRRQQPVTRTPPPAVSGWRGQAHACPTTTTSSSVPAQPAACLLTGSPKIPGQTFSGILSLIDYHNSGSSLDSPLEGGGFELLVRGHR